ncbi:MAG: hypothetical protein QM817_00165 [Archangium sp.]
MVFVLPLILAAATPELAVLSSSGTTGELRFQSVDAKSPAAPVARFSHAEGSPVLGSLLPGTRVVVATAVMKSQGDLSFASALIRLETGREPRLLADQIAYGSRPLVSAEGRVFVARGNGTQLTVDEIDPRTAKTRSIHSVADGLVTYLAGALGREVIIYEVTEAGSRLIAVHADTLGVRTLVANMNGPAHDFTLDAPRKRVLFTHWNELTRAYQVEEVSLVDGQTRVLATGSEITLLPAVRADGRVLISKGEGLGLLALDGGEGLPARGTGFERLYAERGTLLITVHERPSDFPTVWVNGKPLATPPESRLDLAGVLP